MLLNKLLNLDVRRIETKGICSVIMRVLEL